MKFNFKALLMAAMVASAEAYFLTGPSIITSGRIDPIVNPGGTAAHSHSIIGGSNFRQTVNTTQLQQSQCTSMPIKEDRSSYWFMDTYFEWKNGSFTHLPAGPVIYYLFDSGEATAFPDGLRMISGDLLLRTFDPTSFAQKAVTYLCLDFDGFSPTTNYFPTGPCKDGVRAMINFPCCWDGKNLDSPDHKSHVAFLSEGPDSGSCSDPNFPIRLPRIFIENYLPTNDFEQFRDQAMNSTQPFAFSNGDRTGYSHHADFINGWQEGKLQPVLDNCGATCNSAFGDPQCCANMGFLTIDSDGGNNCKITDLLDEQSIGTIPKLPGNNPIQPEGKRATAFPQPSPAPPFLSPVFVYSGNTPTATGTPVTGTQAAATAAATTTSAAILIPIGTGSTSGSASSHVTQTLGQEQQSTTARTTATRSVTVAAPGGSASPTTVAAESATTGATTPTEQATSTPNSWDQATAVPTDAAPPAATNLAVHDGTTTGAATQTEQATSTPDTWDQTTTVPTDAAAPAATNVAAGQAGTSAAWGSSAVNQNTSAPSPAAASVSPASTCRPKATGAYAKRAARRTVHHHKPNHHNTF